MKDKCLTVVKAVLMALLLLVFPVASGVIATVIQMESPYVMYLQAGFMYVPIIIALILLFFNKTKEENLYLLINKEKKDYLYLIPTILIFIPVVVGGFTYHNTPYFFGALLLYLAVGVSEELYFRGFIPRILSKSFNQNQIIVISTIIFGLCHIATAFTGDSIPLVILTIVNALIFGFMAICLLYLHKSIYPLMLIHFIFDFETKFVLLSGTGLMIAEGIRGGIMLVLAVVFFIILQKNKNNGPISE